MQVPAGIPVDLVLFGMVALFLVLRLRSILGKRQGLERAQTPGGAAARPVIEGRAEPVAPPPRSVPGAETPIGATLLAMRRIDRKFDPEGFLTGAENAFRLILAAFAAGDRGKLRPLLTEATFAAFEGAIASREADGQTQRSELRAILETTIEAASLIGSLASITVRFVSNQISLTLSREGLPVHGADAVTELADRWVFERDLSKGDQTWRLASASAA